MPITVTDVDVFSDILSPATNDPADQALFLAASNQLLANRTRFLFNRLGEPTLLAANQIMARGSTGPTAGKASSDFTLTQLALTTAVAHADNIHTKGGDIVAAGTTNIAGATGMFVHITGATTITAFGTAAAGVQRTLRFDEALTLTHNATSLILPTGANILTVANDTLTALSEGSGNWRVIDYQRADGTPLVGIGATLQASYTGGATIATTAAKPIAFSNAVDATDLLTLDRTFVGGGQALQITMGAATSGAAIQVNLNATSTGTALLVSHQGPTGSVANLSNDADVMLDLDATGVVVLAGNSDGQVNVTSEGSGALVLHALGTGDVSVVSVGGSVDITSLQDSTWTVSSGSVIVDPSDNVILRGTDTRIDSSLLHFLDTASAPIITQETNVFASATGAPMLIHSQDMSGGGTTTTGAALTVRAGNSSGAATAHAGGVLTLASGTGDDTDGNVVINRGTTNVFSAGTTTTVIVGPTQLDLSIAGTPGVELTSTILELRVPTLRFDVLESAPVIQQESDGTADATGQLMTIHGQDVVGGGALTTGGALTVRAGNSNGAATTHTGGLLTLASGIGDDNDGEILIKRGAVDVLTTIGTSTILDGASVIAFDVGGATQLHLSSNLIEIRAKTLRYDVAESAPIFTQETDATNSITGQTLLVQAQNATGTTTTGGIMDIRSGTGTTSIGEGVTDDGDFFLRTGSTTFLSKIDKNVILTADASGTVSIQAPLNEVILDAAIIRLTNADLRFDSGETSPVFFQETDTGTDATGQLMLIHAQDVSGGGTTITAGAMLIRGGNASGAATSDIGGALTVKPGSGTTTGGIFTIQQADGTDIFTVDDTGIAFFAGTTQALPAAYTRTATVVLSRTLDANGSASAANNNAVIAQMLADFYGYNLLQGT